ncbi:MAG TPA: nuclear transport factor 2 family protein [Miltoncostaeaceae bacterium]|nr:nuclear transport factor 2 family protein [Miltoncostaeaceae bacterium]
MSAADVEVVRGVYEAFARGDIAGVVAGFAPDVVWVEPEGAPGGFGRRVLHGMDEVVAEVFMRLPEVWDDFRIEPRRYLDAGDVVVMQGTLRARVPATGEEVTSPVAHICDMRDGRIAHWQALEDTRRMQEAQDRAGVAPGAEMG